MSRKRVEMYEELMPDGRCKYRLPYKDILTRKNKTLSIIMDTRSSSNYKIALRTLQDKLEKMERGTSDITLKELGELYLEDRARSLKPSTLQRNKQAVEHAIEWLGAEVYLGDLTAPYVKKVFAKHCPKAMTYNECIKRFKTLINWAYMNDYLESKALSDKLQLLPDNRKERIEDKYLEREELQKLLEVATFKYWRLVIKFLALSGLRIGELISLKDSDVNKEYIHVHSTYEVGIGIESETPKTDTSTRDVFLRPELKACVNEIRSFMKVYQFEHGIRSELFYPWSDGSYFHYDAFRKYLRETSEKALKRSITPHALRHTTASLLIADGVPLETVSRMLGHANSKITKEIYLHITEGLKERDNKLLKEANML